MLGIRRVQSLGGMSTTAVLFVYGAKTNNYALISVYQVAMI